MFSNDGFFHFCCSNPNKGSQIFYHEIRRGIMLMFPSNTARFHTGHCLPSQSLGRKFSLIRQIDIFMNVLLFERSYIRNVQSSFKYNRIAAVLFRYVQ